MSLYKRKDSPNYWIKLCVNGRRLQRSAGTSDRQKAKEYHDKLKAQLWDESRLGIKPEHTWNEAVFRWLKETGHKASHEEDKWQLRWLDRFLGGVMLTAISRDLITVITEARRADGVSNARVNRMLEIIRAILRRARDEWEWIDRAPKVPMLPEPKRRIRWLTRTEADALIRELPDHLVAMVRFSLETGLRQRNVTHLEWSQVDLVRRRAWIHPDQAKARKAIAVPLSPAAVTVLRGQLGKDLVYVFPYRGKAIEQPNNWAWRKALKRAGISDFRWHDLRHTWASWHVQSGTPLHVLQELGGWSSAEMVRRYAHLSSEHLAEYADRMSKRSQGATIRLRSELMQVVNGQVTH
ncbi:MAG TPA: site-specific integrase [Gammaproteobacteria bacterium]